MTMLANYRSMKLGAALMAGLVVPTIAVRADQRSVRTSRRGTVVHGEERTVAVGRRGAAVADDDGAAAVERRELLWSATMAPGAV
jgi:hypothetical protein